jgi:hypothetical protein
VADQTNGVESNLPPGESVSATEAFPTIPPEGEAWFDKVDPAYSVRARALLERVEADWKLMQRTERKALNWLRLSEVGLVVFSVASAALAAAPGVSTWLRAGVAALVTGIVALMALFHNAHTWDVKRHAATQLSTEAFAFVNRFGGYASPKPEEECLQAFFTQATTIRAKSELDFAKG